MSLRKGIVVDVHPDDHSVDLVMADDGSRLAGVQVLSFDGSARTGSVDLPEVPKSQGNKWDITKRTGQDMLAVVGFLGRNPVVLGFLYPQVNQMLLTDGKIRRYRHQSDVEFSIDGDANVQLRHPSGTYIRIGENPNVENIGDKSVDGSRIDRNTDKKVSVRVEMAEGKAVLTISPDGEVRLETKSEIKIEADKDISVETKAGISVKAASDILMRAGGVITLDASTVNIPAGKLVASEDVLGGGKSLKEHVHPGVMLGAEKTLPPS